MAGGRRQAAYATLAPLSVLPSMRSPPCPQYALLQEVIYAQGVATQWSAQAMRDAEFSAEFDAEGAAAQGRSQPAGGPG